MSNKRKKIVGLFWVLFLAALLLFSPMLFAGSKHKGHCRIKGLTDIYVHDYIGGEDGGLAHITYWGLPSADPDYYDTLPPEEQAKARKINANVIHAAAFQPTNADIAGTEITGLLKRGRREQRITFRHRRSGTALRDCTTSMPMRLPWFPGCWSPEMTRRAVTPILQGTKASPVGPTT